MAVSYTHLVVAALKGSKVDAVPIYTGRYGLGSKDTTPAQIVAVYHNDEKQKFTLGIEDDAVSYTHLDVYKRQRKRCSSTTWGLRNPVWRN